MTNMSVYLIILIIILLRLVREREVRPSRLWLTPALFLFLVFEGISQVHLTVMYIFVFLVCFILGAGLGMLRSKFEKVRIDPMSGKITSQSTKGGVLLFLIPIVLRLLAPYFEKEGTVILISNALLMISVGSICARRYCLYIKCRQLQGR